VKPRVSVILIARNGARYIAEALESVRQQSLPPLETVVIDGDSTDATAEIARGFPEVTVVAQRSTGIANAYNEGIDETRGELVAFISHDDRWLPDKLAMQVAYLHEHPDVMLCVTHVQHVLEGASPPPGFRTELLERPVPGMIMEALVVRRAVFDRVGRFDPAFAVSEDTDWFARVKDAGLTIGVLAESLVVKRVHDTNSSLVNPAINALLLRALRGSIERKRAASDA
jgi:glycosyltransferase involved in cell wall biosynthesis